MVDRLSSGQIDLIELLEGHGESIALAGAEHPPGEGLSYRRLAEAAGGWVERFRAYGLTPGSRITVQAENSTVLVAFLYGVWCAGLFPLILTPLLPVGRVRELATELRCGPPFTAGDLDLPAGGASAGLIDSDAPATALLTSGSTGSPRGVVHTLANHLCSAIGSAANLPLERDDRWLVALPLSHVAGLSILFRCLLAGATALIARSGSFREDDRGPDDALALLPRATRLSVVPAQLQRLIELPDDRRGALRSVLVGGQAVAPALLQRARAAGIPVLPTYGSTEMASQVATAAPDADLPPGASGRVLPHRRLRIRDGQIEVGGETLCAGYLLPDGIESPPLEPGGWFRTGDCGHLDDNGILTVTGRADGMFISGGENIHPQEIEEVLGAHPAVAVAVVVPAPDPGVRLPPGGVHPVTRQLPGGRRAAGPARQAAAALQAPRALPADAGGRPHAPRQAGPRTTHRAGPHQRRRSGLMTVTSTGPVGGRVSPPPVRARARGAPHRFGWQQCGAAGRASDAPPSRQHRGAARGRSVRDRFRGAQAPERLSPPYPPARLHHVLQRAGHSAPGSGRRLQAGARCGQR